MSVVDGNALAGVLAGVLGADATVSILECRGCGSRAALGRARVYRSDMGSVGRCASCDQVLLTVIDTGTSRLLSLSGCRTVVVGTPLP